MVTLLRTASLSFALLSILMARSGCQSLACLSISLRPRATKRLAKNSLTAASLQDEYEPTRVGQKSIVWIWLLVGRMSCLTMYSKFFSTRLTKAVEHSAHVDVLLGNDRCPLVPFALSLPPVAFSLLPSVAFFPPLVAFSLLQSVAFSSPLVAFSPPPVALSPPLVFFSFALVGLSLRVHGPAALSLPVLLPHALFSHALPLLLLPVPPPSLVRLVCWLPLDWLNRLLV
jgi:hypothetical protein